MRLRDYPIAYKIILLCVLTSMCSLVLAAIIGITYNQHSFKKNLAQEIQVLANVLANRSQAALVFGDTGLAESNLQSLNAREAVSMACLYAITAGETRSDNLFAEYHRAGSTCPDTQTLRGHLEQPVQFHAGYLDIFTPVALEDSPIGLLLIRSSLIDAHQQLLNQGFVAIIALLLASALALLLASRFEKIISEPLLALGQTARLVAENDDYTLRAIKLSDDELGEVVDSFNYMLGRIQQENAKLRESEERFRLLNASSTVGIFQTDVHGRCVYANDQLAKLSNCSISDILSRGWLINIHPEDREDIHRRWETCLHNKGNQSFECRFITHDHDINWVTGHIGLLTSTDGDALGFLGTIADVTALKKAQQQLEHLAFYDILTGLSNRRLFRDRLENLLDEIPADGKGLALLFIDIDHFKHANDTLGHDAGDALLRIVADRLRNLVRGSDTVARLGGDEFTIIITETINTDHISRICDNIIRDLSRTIHLGDQEISMTASIGIALAPEHGDDAETLIKHADLALYKAKDEGRNNFQFFDPVMNTRLMAHLDIMRDVRQALVDNEFVLHLQPQLDLRTQRIIGFEALVRWVSPKRGFVNPADFIPIAEQTGQIIPLGRWILHQACSHMTELLREGLVSDDCSIAVNLSVKQLVEENLVETVKSILAASHLAPHQLELEITESMLMENYDQAIQNLQQLKALGISISIDDFGTGYSSLGYLKTLPIHFVKVDRSFVRDIPEDTDDMAITSAVIAMAHKLNYKVVAEGIETEEQLLFLQASECDYGQGYYFSKPLPFDDVKQYCRSHLNKKLTERNLA